ncbi:MAG: hypothetical protein Q7J84_10675, partial [Sulfuricaulis sp.]|nr:hypothetical protein [Sulfuricaulis sp.]
MNLSEETWGSFTARPARRMLNRNVVSLASDLLPLCDFVCLLLAASLSTLLTVHWLAPLSLAPDFGNDFAPAALVAAVLAPFILY